MKSLINQSSGSERYLHAAAALPLKALIRRANTEPDVALPILRGILTGDGVINFDQRTKTRTAEKIIASQFKPSDAVSFLMQELLEPSTQDSKAAESHRQAASDLLVSLLKHHLSEPGSEERQEPPKWIERILKTFARLAYLQPNATTSSNLVPKPEVTESSRRMFQARLANSLTTVLGSKQVGKAECPPLAVDSIWKQHNKKQDMDLAMDMDDKILTRLVDAQKTLKEISKVVFRP